MIKGSLHWVSLLLSCWPTEPDQCIVLLISHHWIIRKTLTTSKHLVSEALSLKLPQASPQGASLHLQPHLSQESHREPLLTQDEYSSCVHLSLAARCLPRPPPSPPSPTSLASQPPETTLLTGRLHHAGPEARLLVQRVIIRATQLVHMHTGWRANTAVVTHEHVEVLLATGWHSVYRSRLLPSP